MQIHHALWNRNIARSKATHQALPTTLPSNAASAAGSSTEHAVCETRIATTRCVQGIKAKDRVTMYIYTNVDGTVRLPPIFIGTSKTFRYFEGYDLPSGVLYLEQAKSWFNMRNFGLWYKTFCAFARKFTSKSVRLLMDKHSSYASLIDPTGQVKMK